MSIALFIDAQYAFKTFNGAGGPKGYEPISGKPIWDSLDYLKLRKWVETELDDTISDAYYFDADFDPPLREKMLNFLKVTPPKGPGFIVKVGWLSTKELTWKDGSPVVHPNSGEPFQQVSQKSVDVTLAYYLIKSHSVKKWNKLVLVAGDGDFSKPVEDLCENFGVELYIVGGARSISTELQQYAKAVFSFDIDPLHSSLVR